MMPETRKLFSEAWFSLRHELQRHRMVYLQGTSLPVKLLQFAEVVQQRVSTYWKDHAFQSCVGFGSIACFIILSKT